MKRELTGSAYNQRRVECNEALKYFRSIDQRISALRDVSPEMLGKHWESLHDTMRRRARHVVTENQRVLDARLALRQKDLAQFGALMYASHQSLKEDYEVSCLELDWIVEAAREEGALGARLTGAGFGGCAIVLTERKSAEEIEAAIQSGYRDQFHINPSIMLLNDNLEAGIV